MAVMARYSYVKLLEDLVGDAQSVLDVGCGTNSPIGRFEHRVPHSVGIDLHQPALDASRARGLHDDYVRLDVRELDSAFDENSFDAVIANDLLEHLPHTDGER